MSRSLAPRARNVVVALAFAVFSAQAGAAGRLCISADTFTFGNRAVGSSTTATATVTNCGDASVSFTDVSVDPATGSAFHIDSMCKTGLTLQAGAACSLDVNFAPTAPGQTSGGLWLHNTTTAPDRLITFYGRGVGGGSGSASLTFVPASVAFGPQAVGTVSQPIRIELRNGGRAALTLQAIVLTGPSAYDFDYGADDDCPVGATIAAGASCHKSLVFRPRSGGLKAANLVIDSPQLASLAIIEVSGVAQAPSGSASVNYGGMWAAPSETGWAISFTHQDGLIFASWFTYDSNGKPFWLSAALEQQEDGSFAGALDSTTGPSYAAPIFDSSQVTHRTVGTASVSFSDATHGTFAYTLNGVSQVKPLALYTFAAPVPKCAFDGRTAPEQAGNYQDMWFVAAEGGWGIYLTHQGDIIFASWFIYDANGNPTWVSAALTRTGNATYAGALDATIGPPFDSVPFDSTRVTHASAGAATLSFTDGAHAAFSYTLNGISGTKSLVRFVFRAPGTVCE